jgi:hypothetical protein
MTRRAILWCGHVRETRRILDAEGNLRPLTDAEARARGLDDDTLLPADDFKIQVNSLELSFQAARALGVAVGEIHACLLRDDPRPPELRTRPRPATVDALRSLVQEVHRRATPEDALLFVAVNHGVRGEGLATSDPPADELEDEPQRALLTPEKLDECLRPLAGPQVLIVSACYAGQFLPLGRRPDRMVLAACSAEEPYLVQRHDCAWPAFLDELFGAWCEVALWDGVPRAKLPLPDAFDRAEQRLRGAGARNIPLREGVVRWPG